MNRRRAIREIKLVNTYSRKVYGSCTHSYMGCLATHHLQKLLGGTTNRQGCIEQGWEELFANATDEQLGAAREYVEHWYPIARLYLSTRRRIARAVEAFT